MYIAYDDFRVLLLCALRYCYGRKTYMPSLVREITLNKLDALTDDNLKDIIKDIEFCESDDSLGDGTNDKTLWLLFKGKLVLELNKRQKRAE